MPCDALGDFVLLLEHPVCFSYTTMDTIFFTNNYLYSMVQFKYEFFKMQYFIKLIDFILLSCVYNYYCVLRKKASFKM